MPAARWLPAICAVLLSVGLIAAPRSVVAADDFADIVSAANAQGDRNFKVGLERYNQKDYPRALAHWRSAALNGHAEAMYRLAKMYEAGRGMRLDKRLALKWYRQAAEYDHTGAMMKLGELEDWGHAVAPYYDKVVPKLVDKLYVGKSFDRYRAIRALNRIGQPARQAVTEMIRALDDKERFVQHRAVKSLIKVANSYQEGEPDLIKTLADGDPKVRYGAQEALKAIVPYNESRLSNLLQDDNYDVRRGVARILSARKKVAVPALVKLLGKDEPLLRTRVVRTLDAMGPAAHEAIPTLVKLLRDESEQFDVRNWSASALGEIGVDVAKSKKHVFDLRSLLNHKEHYIRTAAKDAFKKISRAAVPTMIDALKDPDKKVRAYAAATLGDIDSDFSKAAVPALIDLLKDKDQTVRESAQAALKKIQGK